VLFYWRAFRTLLRGNRTVLITRNVNFLPWAWLLKRRKGMRVYLEAHNFWAAADRRHEPHQYAQWRQARLEHAWVPRIDGVICISAPLARLFRQYYPAVPVLVAPPGTTANRPPYRPHFTYTLGYIGGFDTTRYPLDIVMRALANTPRPELRLLCIGAARPEDQRRIRALAERCGVAHRVRVYPWLTGQALEQLKAEIDVGVAVLADTFLTRLVCPTKIFEYLAMATPFIASRLEGIAAVVRDRQHGMLVENTPAAWGRAMQEIYADFARYQQLAQQCHAAALTMQWDQRARRILQALTSGELAAGQLGRMSARVAATGAKGSTLE
jgi:glycosyltransferase involved in cell wall biosynthesis